MQAMWKIKERRVFRFSSGSNFFRKAFTLLNFKMNKAPLFQTELFMFPSIRNLCDFKGVHNVLTPSALRSKACHISLQVRLHILCFTVSCLATERFLWHKTLNTWNGSFALASAQNTLSQIWKSVYIYSSRFVVFTFTKRRHKEIVPVNAC